MRPVIALIGRPNVGKSTLFNQLTRSRDALVADFPGLTRDRQYGIGRLGGDYLVIDTGGLSGEEQGLDELMAKQTRQAIAEADHVIWLTDARDGLTHGDERIAAQLRQSGKPVTLAVNKIDGCDEDIVLADFHALGFGQPLPIAAVHGRGLGKLIASILPEVESEGTAVAEEEHAGIKLAFVGRPNVGKSTLVNRMLGEERVVASEMPGTTRDSIYIAFERDGQAYTLIDTAGVRRRGRVHEVVEKFSVVKTLQAIAEADVVIHLLDAREGITDQDLHLLGHSIEAGRAIVIAINKWDGLDEHTRQKVKDEMDFKLGFLDFAERYTISALHGSGVGLLYAAVQRAWESGRADLPTTRLTQLLEEAQFKHQPPLVRGRRIKLRYAHQGGKNPPIIVIHGNQTERLPESYRRYLSNYFRQKLKLVGTPLRLEFRTSENPFAGRRNKLTPRQEHKRKRLQQHTKKKK
jgi:GTP-binding protein